MDGASRARSADSLKDLIKEARQIEDEAWSKAAELRQTACDNEELMRAVRLLEKATSHRVRLEQELQAAGPKS